MATERIEIIVTEKGSRTVKRDIEQIGTAAGATASVLGLLKSALASVGALFAAGEIVRYLDAHKELRNVLAQVVQRQDQLNAVTTAAYQIANKYGVQVSKIGNLLDSVGDSTYELGLSMQDQIDLTDKLVALSEMAGGSFEAAGGSVEAFLRVLVDGKVEGRELKAVLRQVPEVLDLFGAALGTTRQGLMKMIDSGELTSAMMADMLLNNEQINEALTEAHSRVLPTVSKAFTVLGNKIQEYLGNLDAATGVSQIFIDLILGLANNLDLIGRAATAAAVVFGPSVLVGAIMLATRAMIAFTAAALANPIVSLGKIILTIIGVLVAFSDQITLSSDKTTTLGDVAIATFGFIVSALEGVIQFFSDAWSLISGAAETAFGGINITIEGVLYTVASVIDGVIGFFVGGYNAIVLAFTNLPAALEAIFISAFNAIQDLFLDMINFIIRGINDVSEAAGLGKLVDEVLPDYLKPTKEAQDLGEAMGKAIADGIAGQNGAKNAVDSILGDAKAAAAARAAAKANEPPPADLTTPNSPAAPVTPGDEEEKVKKKIKTFQELIGLIKQDTALMQLNGQEREVQNQLLGIEDDLKRKLTDGERAYAEEVIRANVSMQERMQVLESIKGPQEQLLSQMASLNALFAQGKITAGEFNTSMRSLNLELINTRIQLGEGGFADGFISELGRMTEAATRFTATAGQQFGTFIGDLTSGLGDAAGQAIVFGEDFDQAIGDVARQALASLISSLVQLGIQFLINATIGEALAATATAASTAMAAGLATAWATPAALASLATLGTNAAPAIAAVTGTIATTQALSAVQGFADGGLIQGAGTSRSDSNLAWLSNGEFVMNAAATKRFLPMLMAMNDNTPSFANGGLNGSTAPALPSSGGAGGDIYVTVDASVIVQGNASKQDAEAISAAQAKAAKAGVEAAMDSYVARESRPGGKLWKPAA